MKLNNTLKWTILSSLLLCSMATVAQNSVARMWMEVQLNCIRKDAARPTVQARNLAHAGILMYDLWAVYDDDAATVLLGNTFNGFTCPFDGIALPEDREEAQSRAISYGMYRYLTNRYQPFAPTPAGAPANNWVVFMQGYLNDCMQSLGYDPAITSTDYSDGDPAKLGNYLALRMQQYALTDGANQSNNYANTFYQTVNGNLWPEIPGNALHYDINRWQPLALSLALDQNNLPISNGAPALSPEWGNVKPWSLQESQSVVKQRDGNNWRIYLDPGPFALIDTVTEVERQWDEDEFRWNFVVNILWHALHDPSDGVSIDISPNSVGNIDHTILPQTFQEYKDFYIEMGGGPSGPGYEVNPATGQPYSNQIVPRADYTRVLAEYWADGPSSETPPGHWFKNVNAISAHPMFEKRWMGQGEVLPDLEWDVKAYFALGGGIMDAAIACWSAKGYYDGVRPIMAIRSMCVRGQCSDISLPNYHPAGIPLVPGYIEVIQAGDPLAGTSNEHLGKIKLYTFRGPVAATGQDNVGWILGENWWTFQRRTFVTPPFPGYYSGHSTYSRTAAEILTLMTGSEYYPGGVGEFTAQQNAYLPATVGPSVTTTLQWAKYFDAADQCSLSRIYGGLHPPMDDIPGRKVGAIVGPQAFNKASTFINAGIPKIIAITHDGSDVINDASMLQPLVVSIDFSETMNPSIQPQWEFIGNDPIDAALSPTSESWFDADTYQIVFTVTDGNIEMQNITLRIGGAEDTEGNVVVPMWRELFDIDTRNPLQSIQASSATMINDAAAASGVLEITYAFDQAMDQMVSIVQTAGEDLGVTLLPTSTWVNEQTFQANFSLSDADAFGAFEHALSGFTDTNGNPASGNLPNYVVDTQNPMVNTATPSMPAINLLAVGNGYLIDIAYTENMQLTTAPVLAFAGDNLEQVLTLTGGSWINPFTYRFEFSVSNGGQEFPAEEVTISGGIDANGNLQVSLFVWSIDGVDFSAPNVVSAVVSTPLIIDASLGTVQLAVSFDDEMDTESTPVWSLLPLPLGVEVVSSEWLDPFSFVATVQTTDGDEEILSGAIVVSEASDEGGNALQSPFSAMNAFVLDTRNPRVEQITTNVSTVTNAQIGTGTFQIFVTFDEAMTEANVPVISFPGNDLSTLITFNAAQSGWINPVTYHGVYDVNNTLSQLSDVDVQVAGGQDVRTNPMVTELLENAFDFAITVGVADVNQSLAQWSVYPNPLRVGEALVVQLAQSDSALVQVFDPAGKLVASQRVTSDRMSLNTSGWASGVYTVQLIQNGTENSTQIVLHK
jgi:hypothetical protein